MSLLFREKVGTFISLFGERGVEPSGISGALILLVFLFSRYATPESARERPQGATLTRFPRKFQTPRRQGFCWSISARDRDTRGAKVRKKRKQRIVHANPEVYEKVRGAAEVIQWNLANPGRPSKYHEGFCHLVEQTTLIGGIKDDLARILGASGTAIDEWMHGNTAAGRPPKPGFAAAIKRGRERADAQVERSLHARALGYSHPEDRIFCHEGGIITAETTKHYPPDTAAAFIWLKNRKPKDWRDRVEMAAADPDEAAAAVRERLKAIQEQGG